MKNLNNAFVTILLVASATLFAQHSGNANQDELSKKEMSGNVANRVLRTIEPASG